MVLDREAPEKLINEALKLIFDLPRGVKLVGSISKLAKPAATSAIVDEIENMIIRQGTGLEKSKGESRKKQGNESINQQLLASGLQPVMIKK